MGKKLIHFVSLVYFNNNKLFSYFAHSMTHFSNQYALNFCCVSLHNSLNNLLKKYERPGDPLSWSNEFLLLKNQIECSTLIERIFTITPFF